MQVVLDEVTTIRKPEDESSSSDRSGGTLDTTMESADQAELIRLRKDVRKYESEKANLEMEFMTQLSTIQRKSMEEIDNLRSQLKEVKANSSYASANKNVVKDDDFQQMKRDLASADQELLVTRKDVDEMVTKIKKLEGQKLALIDEITGVRMELETQSKVITSLNEVMIENEKHFKNQVDKLQAEIKVRDASIVNHKNKLLQLNDSSIGLSGQKAMLLDEITDLRMQLDREEKSKEELEGKCNELMKQKGHNNDGGVVIGALQQRATTAEARATELEETIEVLENELRSVTKSYKADMSRVEESILSKEAALATEKKIAEDKHSALEKQEELNEQMRTVIKTLKVKLDQQTKLASDHEREIAGLTSQNITFERKLSESAGNYSTELDQLKVEKESLQHQINSLNKELVTEKIQREEMEIALESEKDKLTELSSKLEVQAKTVAAFKADLEKQEATNQLPDAENRAAESEEPDQLRVDSKEKPATHHHLNQRRASGTPSTSTFPPYMRPPSPGVATATPPRLVSRGRPLSSPSRPVGGSPPGSSSNRVMELAARFDKSTSNSGSKANDNDNVIEQDAGFPVKERAAKMSSPRGLPPSAPVVVATPVEIGPSLTEITAEMEGLQQELDMAKTQNDLLKQKLHKQCEVVGELRAEVATLGATRSAIQALARKEYEKQSRADKMETKRVEEELSDVRNQLDAAENRADALKKEIKMMTSERLQYEETAMDAFDRRIAANQKNYDAELNKLKVELTSAQMSKAQLEKDYQNQVKELEEAIEELNLECDKEIDEKQAELDMIRYKHDAQLDELQRLKKEKDQLTLSMNSHSSTRKGELEELQAEVMEKTSRNTAMAREIQKLEMQVEHHHDQSRDIERLRRQVTDLQKRLESQPTGTKAQLKQIELERIQRENCELRESLRNTGIEKRAIQDKLSRTLETQSEDRSVQILRHRNEKLRKEVERLTRKLEKLVGSVERIAI